MINLEQIRLLESRITRALELIRVLKEENSTLRRGLESAQKRMRELESMVDGFKTDQKEIESIIVRTLHNLDDLEETAAGASTAAGAAAGGVGASAAGAGAAGAPSGASASAGPAVSGAATGVAGAAPAAHGSSRRAEPKPAPAAAPAVPVPPAAPAAPARTHPAAEADADAPVNDAPRGEELDIF